MIVFEILAYLLLGAGTLLLLAAAVGVLRFPDFYTRLHAAGKGDTAGQFLVLLGLVCIAGVGFISVKLAAIAFFIFILNPTATHALARGAWVCGVRPWMGERERPFVQREGQLDDEAREAVFTPVHAWTSATGAPAATPPAEGPADGSEGGSPWTT